MILKLCISRTTQYMPFCAYLLFVTQHLLDLFVLRVVSALQYPILWTYVFFSSLLLLDFRLFPGFGYKENHGESCFTFISCVYGVGKCVMVYLCHGIPVVVRGQLVSSSARWFLGMVLSLSGLLASKCLYLLIHLVLIPFHGYLVLHLVRIALSSILWRVS